jgi:hypothetical protein
VLNYNEIQNPRKRKGIIDFDRLMDLLGFEIYDDLKMAKLIIWIPETHFYGINLSTGSGSIDHQHS